MELSNNKLPQIAEFQQWQLEVDEAEGKVAMLKCQL